MNSLALYDSSTGMWTIIANMNSSRYNHLACVLTNEQVLVVGGVGNGVYLSSAKLYQP